MRGRAPSFSTNATIGNVCEGRGAVLERWTLEGFQFASDQKRRHAYVGQPFLKERARRAVKRRGVGLELPIVGVTPGRCAIFARDWNWFRREPLASSPELSSTRLVAGFVPS